MEQYGRIASIVFEKDGLGYVRNNVNEGQLKSAVALAMLANRNPYIDALTIESLHAASQLACDSRKREVLGRVARVLKYLKIVKSDAFTNRFDDIASIKSWEYRDADVDPNWLSWIQAYINQTNGLSESYRSATFYYLIIAGRWLKKYHPTIISPDQWDESLAYEYVTWVCTANRGELVSRDMYLSTYTIDTQVPQLKATSIQGRLIALRLFFKALRKRSYQLDDRPTGRLILPWDPDEVLTTPENIKRQIIPNPRNMDHAWWQKLTWAAASLSAKNLSNQSAGIYPLAYFRAVGLLC
jgi:hypothetical protein